MLSDTINSISYQINYAQYSTKNMTLNNQEVAELKAKILRAKINGQMGKWQHQFLSDMQERLERYGTKARFSSKQWAKLNEIIKAQKITGNIVELKTAKRAASKAATKKQRQGRSYKRNKFSWRRLPVVIAGFLLIVVAASRLFDGASFSVPSLNVTAIPVELSVRDFTVTDGDTILLRGASKGTRLVGFNTPETFKPVDDAVFEVNDWRGSPASAFWCAAANYARRQLRIDWNQRLFVARTMGPSVTSNRGAAVHFTVNQDQVDFAAGSAGRSLASFVVGDNMTVQRANTYCQIGKPIFERF